MKKVMLEKPLALFLAILMVFSIGATSAFYVSAETTGSSQTLPDGVESLETVLNKSNKVEVDAEAEGLTTFNQIEQKIQTIQNGATVLVYLPAQITLETGSQINAQNNKQIILLPNKKTNATTVALSATNDRRPVLRAYNGGTLRIASNSGSITFDGEKGMFSHHSFINAPSDTPSGGTVIVEGNVKFEKFSKRIGGGSVISMDHSASRLYILKDAQNNGVTFDKNLAADKGGAVYVGSGTGAVFIDGATFTGNVVGLAGTTQGEGGALTVEREDSVTVSNCTFTSNTAGRSEMNHAKITTPAANLTLTNNTIGGVLASDSDAAGFYTLKAARTVKVLGDGVSGATLQDALTEARKLFAANSSSTFTVILQFGDDTHKDVTATVNTMIEVTGENRHIMLTTAPGVNATLKRGTELNYNNMFDIKQNAHVAVQPDITGSITLDGNGDAFKDISIPVTSTSDTYTGAPLNAAAIWVHDGATLDIIGSKREDGTYNTTLTNCRKINLSMNAQDAAGITVEGTGKATINGANFTNNLSANGSAVSAIGGATVTLTNVKFDQNIAVMSKSPAIWAKNSASATRAAGTPSTTINLNSNVEVTENNYQLTAVQSARANGDTSFTDFTGEAASPRSVEYVVKNKTFAQILDSAIKQGVTSSIALENDSATGTITVDAGKRNNVYATVEKGGTNPDNITISNESNIYGGTTGYALTPKFTTTYNDTTGAYDTIMELGLYLTLDVDLNRFKGGYRLSDIQVGFKFNNQLYTPVDDRGKDTANVVIIRQNDTLPFKLQSTFALPDSAKYNSDTYVLVHANAETSALLKENKTYLLGTMYFKVNDTADVFRGSAAAEGFTWKATIPNTSLTWYQESNSGFKKEDADYTTNKVTMESLKDKQPYDIGFFETIQLATNNTPTEAYKNLDAFVKKTKYNITQGSDNNEYFQKVNINALVEENSTFSTALVYGAQTFYPESYASLPLNSLTQRSTIGLQSAFSTENQSFNKGKDFWDKRSDEMLNNTPTDEGRNEWNNLTNEERQYVDMWDYIGTRTYALTNFSMEVISDMSYTGKDAKYNDMVAKLISTTPTTSDLNKSDKTSTTVLLNELFTKFNSNNDTSVVKTGTITTEKAVDGVADNRAYATVKFDGLKNGSYDLLLHKLSNLPYMQMLTIDITTEQAKDAIKKKKAMDKNASTANITVTSKKDDLDTRSKKTELIPGDVVTDAGSATAVDGLITLADQKAVSEKLGAVTSATAPASKQLTDKRYDIDDNGVVASVDVNEVTASMQLDSRNSLQEAFKHYTNKVIAVIDTATA